MFTSTPLSLYRCILALSVGVLLVCPPALHAQSREYDVKAAFLFNIVNFVTWPPEAFSGASDPVRVCVADTDPFGSVLDEVMKGESAGARPIEVVRVHDAEEMTACHLVFVPSRSPHLQDILQVVGTRPIVTVGETTDFLKRGGLINFVIENVRVRFDVNEAAAISRGLAFSSKLLRVARNTAVPGA